MNWIRVNGLLNCTNFFSFSGESLATSISLHFFRHSDWLWLMTVLLKWGKVSKKAVQNQRKQSAAVTHVICQTDFFQRQAGSPLSRVDPQQPPLFLFFAAKLFPSCTADWLPFVYALWARTRHKKQITLTFQCKWSDKK